jgi:hypothetical protein
MAGDPPRTVAGSVTRITDFDSRPPQFETLPRERWKTGDYVAGEVLGSGLTPYRVETVDGSYEEVEVGDRIIGALGARAATLEAVGDWRAVQDELVLDTLTAAAVLGRCTSAAVPPPPMARVRYLGHARREGRTWTMTASVAPLPKRRLKAPIVLIIGTSMSAGKTVSAGAITRELTRMGKRVAGAKLTGVGRYRDILAMREAGAEWIADFVDAGLPSTVVPRTVFEPALEHLCSKLAGWQPDVVVAEAGASPLEPYNGEAIMTLLAENLRAIVLCASDPYAVVGVMSAFGIRPDLIAGRATSTEAALALIEKLVSIPAVNVLDPGSGPKLASFLRRRLG